RRAGAQGDGGRRIGLERDEGLSTATALHCLRKACEIARIVTNAPLNYGDFARMLYATGILSDPWLGGKKRSRLHPPLLPQPQAERLRTAAERVGQVYHELSEIVIRRPELLDQFFNLTPWQKRSQE